MASWIALAALFGFLAGVAIAAYAFRRTTVPKGSHDAVLRQLENQRETIDGLLAVKEIRTLADLERNG